MKSMLAAMALVALAAAQTQTTKYADLIELPGTDFVGFGYDARYEDPAQGLRLPLITYTFDKAKTYRYPLYRDRVYRTPDQLFTRTVAATEAVNYISTSIEDHTKSLAVSAGISVSVESSKPVQSTGAIPPPTATPPTGTNALSSSPSVAGAPNPYASMMANANALPGRSTNMKTTAFSIGASFDFVKNSMNNSEHYVTQNDQVFQLYQVLLNEALLRESLAADIRVLSGKTWQTDQVAYLQFFERYGTHYIQNAVMGGAISQTSIVHKTTQTDYLRAAVSLSVNYTSDTSTTVETSRTTDVLVLNSPKCINNASNFQEGWGFNALRNACEIPPEATCIAAMPFVEEFDYSVSDWNNRTYTTQWRNGPRAQPANIFQVYYTTYTYCWRWCWWCRCYWYTVRVPWYYIAIYTGSTSTITPTASVDGGSAMSFDTSSQNFVQQATGLYREFQGDQYPEYISFYAKVDTSTSASNRGSVTIFFGYRGDNTTESDNQDGVHLTIGTVPKLQAPKWTAGADSTDSQVCLVRPQNSVFSNTKIADKPVVTCTRVPGNYWFEVRLVLDWEKYTFNTWINSGQNTFNGGRAQIYRPGALRDWKFTQNAPGFQFMNIWATKEAASSSVGRVWLDKFSFCNDAKGAAYQPVSTTAAVAATTSHLRTVVTGSADFTYETSYSNFKMEQVQAYKLKGGDSSQVDLLDPRQTQAVFDTWKTTIPINPAPVSYTMKEVAELFPREKDSKTGVSPRDLMHEAIALFLHFSEIGEIYYRTNPDQPKLGDELINKGISVPWA